jgi:hypothetical protein
MDIENNKNMQPESESIFGRRIRKYPRTQIRGFDCQLANSKSLFKGTIDELSVQGFRMSNVPITFCDESMIFRAILSEGENYYKITVIPRWSKKMIDGEGFEVGFKILDHDWKWVHFSMDTLPSKMG